MNHGVNVNFNVNIQKRHIWIFAGLVLFLVGAGLTVAFGDYSSGDAEVMGHSADEILVNVSGSLVSLQDALGADSGDVDLQTIRNAVLYLKVPNSVSWCTGTASGGWQTISTSTKTLLPMGGKLRMYGSGGGEGGGVSFRFAVEIGGIKYYSTEGYSKTGNWVELDASDVPFASSPTEYSFTVDAKGDWYKQDVCFYSDDGRSGSLPPLYWDE